MKIYDNIDEYAGSYTEDPPSPSPQNGLSSLKHPVMVAKNGTAASTCMIGNVGARCLCMFLSGRFFKKWKLLKKRFKQLPLFRL